MFVLSVMVTGFFQSTFLFFLSATAIPGTLSSLFTKWIRSRKSNASRQNPVHSLSHGRLKLLRQKDFLQPCNWQIALHTCAVSCALNTARRLLITQAAKGFRPAVKLRISSCTFHKGGMTCTGRDQQPTPPRLLIRFLFYPSASAMFNIRVLRCDFESICKPLGNTTVSPVRINLLKSTLFVSSVSHVSQMLKITPHEPQSAESTELFLDPFAKVCVCFFWTSAKLDIARQSFYVCFVYLH